MLYFEDSSEELYGLRKKIVSIKNENGLIHFFNEDGQEVYISEYVEIEDYNNGFLKVKNKDGLYGVINLYGDQILPCDYVHIGRNKSNGTVLICETVDADEVSFIDVSVLAEFHKDTEVIGIKYTSKININGMLYTVSAEDPAGIIRKKIELLEKLRSAALDFEEEALALETDMMSEDYEDRLNRGL